MHFEDQLTPAWLPSAHVLETWLCSVYVFNRGNIPLLIFDTDGNLLNKWGNETPGLGTETIPSTGDTMSEVNRWKGSEFIRPHAITIDHEDNLWLVDDDANVITKCDRDGNRVRVCVKLCNALAPSIS